MKTKLTIRGSWQDVVDAARFTVGKPPLGKEPSKRFKENMLIAEHSPIRLISIRWIWEAIPHWVGVHWVRHKWECFVATQRTDRTGVNRDKLPQDTPQDFMGDANPQHLIDSMRKRLCYKASPETRKLAEDLKKSIGKAGEEEISFVLVPNCVYRCGCPEEDGCGYWQNVFLSSFFDSSFGKNTISDLCDISTRYEHYNYMFNAMTGVKDDE